jgi:2-keto-4-pentenoate hydratase/2-oxohepta-3-ene-1,7-dioic acid hydratase in catechol pathway
MKVIRFAREDGVARPGALVADGVVDFFEQGFVNTRDVIAGRYATRTAGARVPLDRVRLLPPIANPPRIFCIGLNYRDHALEAKMKIPDVPTVFLKLPSAITGPGAPIVLPKNSTQPDYEAEMAVVIGQGGFRIAADAWREHVFGYTILNDVSARDVQLATSQWLLGKSFPTFCPIGPAIVTADEVADPHDLDVRLDIDGEEMQHSNTGELIFRVPQLIEYISSITPLEPGDLISTGTPQGVGLGRKPQRWLQPGETVTIEITGLGKLVNPIVAEL